jgi:hypothetical protein
MSFQRGDRIHLHDGRVVRVRRNGTVPKIKRDPTDHSLIRGFVRAALVGPDGVEEPSDYYENIVTIYGHQHIVRNFVGLASSASSVMATVLSDMALARYWGIGYHTQGATSNFSTAATIDSSEYGLASTGGVSRATVSVGQQVLSGTWSLSQSFSYASSQISHAVTVNCIAQYANSSVGNNTTAGPALSIATFQSSTKGTTQALNVTYNWLFST